MKPRSRSSIRRAGLIGEWIHSQIALHERHGGVVPDLATREHLRHFGPLLERAKNEIGFAGITQIAVTNGPASRRASRSESRRRNRWRLRGVFRCAG